MKKALFFINTLSNGGAERVVINLANEMARQGYEVDIILLGQSDTNRYDNDCGARIFDLEVESKNKVVKVIKIILAVKKVNRIIRKREKGGKYNIITSHLPMSNFLTRLSIVRKRAIYVFHLPLRGYDHFRLKIVYRFILWFMFKNKKVSTVSDGVRSEAVNDYGFSKKNVRTIYNPIDIQMIHSKMDEPVHFTGKYFLNVGRFCKEKRQDLTLDVFYRGGFYKEYSLIFCGEGETKKTIKKRAKQLGLSDRVLFLDWQPNIYKWMNNAELLISNSLFESFSMVVAEALACGTKVVSSDCDFGPREILVGEYERYLVKGDTVDDYIRTIDNALKSYPSQGSPFIEKCRPDLIVGQYLEYMKA